MFPKHVYHRLAEHCLTLLILVILGAQNVWKQLVRGGEQCDPQITSRLLAPMSGTWTGDLLIVIPIPDRDIFLDGCTPRGLCKQHTAQRLAGSSKGLGHSQN